jgi:hypothetical protein
MADKVAGLLFKISADTRALRQGFRQTQKSVSAVKKSMIALRGVMIGTFGAHTVIRGIRNVAKTFMDFEQSMANVKAISRANQEEFKRLSKLARDLGGTTAWTASQVAQLETEYAKLGFTVKEIENAAEATLNLATAAGTDLARAAEVVGGVIRAYGKDASEATRVTDIMAHAFSSSALDMEKFAEAMKYVGPVASSANITLEESTALVAILANNMIDGSMAGTGLRLIINQLAKSGKPLAERLKELADRGLSLAAAEGEVGKRAQTALLVLAKNAELLPELTAEYDNVTGSTKRMADIMLDTVEGEMKLFKSAFDELKITIGEMATASGELKEAISSLTTGLQGFTTFLKSDWLKTIRSATSAFWDFLVPTRILARNWDKLFPSKAEWRNAGVGRLGTSEGGSGGGGGAGGGLSLLPAGQKGVLGGAYRMGGGGGGGPAGIGIPSKKYGANLTPGVIGAGGMMQFTSQLGAAATQVRETIVPQIKEAMMDLGFVVQQTFMTAMDAFSGFIEALSSGKLEGGFNTILAAFGGFMVQMGKMLVAYGISISAFWQALENPAALIAAGIALIAVGSAIKGLASRGPAVGGASMGRGASPAMQPVQVVGKISGSNILLASERAAAQRSATT